VLSVIALLKQISALLTIDEIASSYAQRQGSARSRMSVADQISHGEALLAPVRLLAEEVFQVESVFARTPFEQLLNISLSKQTDSPLCHCGRF
jgi:hypothetical protein